MSAYSSVEELNALPLMLTPNQVADILAVTPKHVRCLIHSGQIRAVRVGKCWRIGRDTFLQTFFPDDFRNESRIGLV